MYRQLILALLGLILFIGGACYGVFSDAPPLLCLLTAFVGGLVVIIVLGSLPKEKAMADQWSEALRKLGGKIEQAEAILGNRVVTPAIEQKARQAIDQCNRQLRDLQQVDDWRPFQLEILNIFKLPEYVEQLVVECPYK